MGWVDISTSRKMCPADTTILLAAVQIPAGQNPIPMQPNQMIAFNGLGDGMVIAL
jgi:hypothetical protein